MTEYVFNDELKHYGVLGMKWGMRRAANRGTNYHYESMNTKIAKAGARGATRRLEKARRKGASQEKIAKRERQLGKANDWVTANKRVDSKRVAYAKKTSVGKAVAQNILGMGDNTYVTVRSLGGSRKVAAGAAAANAALGFLSGYQISNFGSRYFAATSELANMRKH